MSPATDGTLRAIKCKIACVRPIRPSVRDNVRLAVAAVLGSNLALSLSDAAIKLISADFVLWQIFVIRSIIAIPLLIAVIRLRSRSTSLAPRHFGWVALRSLMLTFMWVAYVSALPHLALGVAAITLYTLPIFITIFAALFIGDRIGLMGWGSVLLGFAGVLLILKPTPDGFNGYALLPLVSAILYALAMILTRTKCREENPLVLSLSAQFLVRRHWALGNAPDSDGRRIYRRSARHILPFR